MRQRIVRGVTWLALALTGGIVFQPVNCTTGTGSIGNFQRLVTNGMLTSVDFCYIFDCQSGFAGGAIQPCGDPTTTLDDLFVDCSAPVGDTGTTP
ncbi:MAG: hypothetical protein HY718_08760 [Planctomycetes bacterium]|nr:hypothetical protein [Planctomycetota bacterium]